VSKHGRVIVAMSGGVDSAVAAARLHDDGFEVIGVTLHLWDYPDDGSAHDRCCAPEDQYDARRTADTLGFAHFTFDRRELFERSIVQPFVDAYLSAETPSPCTSCNQKVKLKELFALADRLGAEKIATGHYARTGKDGEYPFIAEGKDRGKDQSYFLYATPKEQIERLLFPLGESTKPEVRAEAIARKLPGAHKGESQELCFVGREYAGFVEERAKGRVRPGPIVDGDGRVVGEHAGLHRFTVGQRKGIGVALGKPAFVTRIDPESAAVHLGDEEALLAKGAELEDIVLAPGISLPRPARARVRYRHDGQACEVDANGTVRFAALVRAVTRGQIAVLYDRDRVLGGGRIRRALALDSTV
jgi:tRNA-specific 2-thiouridylase